MHQSIVRLFLLVFLSIIAGCTSKKTIEKEADIHQVLFQKDLPEIINSDTLRVIMVHSPTSYFLYRGIPMGFDYDLISRFAKQLEIKLDLIIANDIDSVFEMLNNGNGDLVAYNLTVTKARKNIAGFTLPLNLTRQVLVQPKPDNWREMKLHKIEKELIRNPLKLVNKEIFVRKNSSYHERLLNLEEELGVEINIQFLPGNISTNEALSMVNNGEIPLTVSDENIAVINKSNLSNIDIQTPIGILQQLSWSVRKNSPELLDTLNSWITEIRKKDEFYVLYNKYYKNNHAFRTRTKSDLFSLGTNQISPYDDLIKKHSKNLGWDWRLVTALIFRESKFDAEIESWVGAVGLMQLMPNTANSYCIEDFSDPEQNIIAGTRHLQHLNDYWKSFIPDSLERVKFVLASYNVGQNHVQDARKLAEMVGYDPNVWYENVEKSILLKSDRKYYSKEPVKFGYCRGSEPVKYVKDILKFYEGYKDFVPLEDPQKMNN